MNIMRTLEPGHEKICLMPYAINNGADQPAHLCSLISVFVVRCIDSNTPIVAIPEIISRLCRPIYVLPGQTSEDRFSHDEGHFSLGQPSNFVWT